METQEPLKGKSDVDPLADMLGGGGVTTNDPPAPTPEQTAALELQQKATALGGNGFDEQGNLLDAAGTVLKTKAELDGTPPAPPAGTPPVPPVEKTKVIEANLALDDEGNLVDKVSKAILVKKEDVKFNAEGTEVVLPDTFELEQAPVQETAVGSIQKLMGIETKDENGAPKVYEDTDAGVAQYVQDVVKLKEQEIPKLFLDANPDLKALAVHLANGGTAATFGKTRTYSAVQYDEKNVDLNLRLIKDNLIRKGLDEETAGQLAETYKTQGTWAEKGKLADTELKANEAKIVADREAAIQTKRAQDAKDAEEYWTKMKDVVVNKGTFKGITIPVAQRNDFFNYISVAVDKYGNSQADLDAMNSDDETSIQMKYLQFTKFNLAILAESKAKTLLVDKLRQRVKDRSSGTAPITVKVTNHVPTLEEMMKS